MNRIFIYVFCTILCGMLFAEEEAYQRVSLDPKKNELTVEANLNYWAQTTSADTEFYTLVPSLSMEYRLDKKHVVSIDLPYYLSFSDNGDTNRNVFYALGDIAFVYTYTKKCNTANLFFSGILTVPGSESSEYAEREGVYTPTDGRYDVGITFAVSGVRDPIVWTLGGKYVVGLPKQEHFYTSWQPGKMQVYGSILKLYNERFGFSIGLHQSLFLPQIDNDEWKSQGFSASTFLRMEASVLFDKDYVKVSTDLYTFPLNRPVNIGLSYGHSFEFGGKK